MIFGARLAFAAGFSIAWQAPESCGSERDFEAGVERVVGKPLAELDSAWKSARVVIDEQAGAWCLRVRVTSASGARRAREVRASSCREAVEAAELIVATSLSAAPTSDDTAPDSSEAEPATELATKAAAPNAPAPPPAAPPRAPSEPTQVSSTERAASRAQRPAFTIGARLGLEPWLLPNVTSFGALVAGLESNPLRGELSLLATYPESNAFAGGGGAKAELFAADLLGCAGAHASRFFIWGCLGGEAGAFHVAGKPGAMLTNEHGRTEPWLAALAQVEVGRELGAGLSLALGGAGMATTRRIRVLETGAQPDVTTELYSTRRASLRPFLELSGRFR